MKLSKFMINRIKFIYFIWIIFCNLYRTTSVKEIMNKVAISCDNVCDSPSPIVRFREFGASSLNFELLAWIEKPEYKGQVIDELLTEIYNSFNANSIEIPFPQRTVHIKKTDL